MKAGAVEVYGSALGAHPPLKTFSIFQLIKSLMMDLTISLGTIAIIPLRKKNLVYSLESFKWALRSGYFYLLKKTKSVVAISKIFLKLGIPAKFMHKFLTLRQQNRLKLDLLFALQLPYYVLKVHLVSFAYRKILEHL